MTDVQKQAPSTSWKCGSDLRTLVNTLEIIFGSSGISSAVANYVPTSLTEFHVVAMCIFPCTNGDRKAMAESGWSGYNRSGSGGGGGVISA